MSREVLGTMADRDAGWHVDKKVPITLIAAIIVQTFGAIWWARGLDARVDALEKHSIPSAPMATVQGERIIRLETKLEAITDSLAEIKSILRRDRAEAK